MIGQRTTSDISYNKSHIYSIYIMYMYIGTTFPKQGRFVSQRIQFKVLTLAYNVKHGLAPKYISELLIPRKQPTTRVLRSSSTAHLEINTGPIPPALAMENGPSQSPLPLFGTIFPSTSVPQLHWTHLKRLSKHTYLNPFSFCYSIPL